MEYDEESNMPKPLPRVICLIQFQAFRACAYGESCSDKKNLYFIESKTMISLKACYWVNSSANGKLLEKMLHADLMHNQTRRTVVDTRYNSSWYEVYRLKNVTSIITNSGHTLMLTCQPLDSEKLLKGSSADSIFGSLHMAEEDGERKGCTEDTEMWSV